MDWEKRAKDHNRNANNYLSDTKDSYTISPHTGLYEPNSKHAYSQSDEHPPTHIDSGRPKSNRAEISNAIFSGFGVLISLFTLVGLFLTVLFSVEQWREGHRTADASIISANAAQSAANTATETLRNQQRSFEIDQRPYLVTENPQFVVPPAPDAAINTNVVFKNIGRTPARMIVMHITLLRFDASTGIVGREKYVNFLDKAFAAIEQEDRAGVNERLAKGADEDLAPQGSTFATSPEPVIISAKEFTDLKNGKIGLVFIGVISYTDAFRKPYRTEFCQFYFGDDPKIWHICDSRNTIQ